MERGGRLSNGGARDEGEGARSLRPRRSARASRLATEDSDWDSDMDDEELDEEEGGGRGGGRSGGKEKKKVGRPIAYKGDPDAPGLTEEDRRRIKRRIANRESARRVRQKRQEQLDELEIKVGELARQNQALAAHLAEVEAHKGQLAAQVAALRERWQGAAAENLRLTGELAALRKTLQAQMGDVPLPASVPVPGAGEMGGLAALSGGPERLPSAPSPAEFFGNIAALTSGSYGGLPAPGSLDEGPDLAGPLSLDAPGLGQQQLLEDWRSISGPAAAHGGEVRRGRGVAPPMPAPVEEPSPPLQRMARIASPAVNAQRGWSGDLQSLLRAASISAAADGLSDIFDDVDEVVGGEKPQTERMDRQPSVPSRRKAQGPKAAI
ncbi:hypothetical protein WJX81_001658 [Elliptochloris bilobata]|uniref:BZIP domain-containing protein n=1 Tax=Elliptochloris bilobata TaxID=381761 RepID=A0AAW1S3H7_9CHLO